MYRDDPEKVAKRFELVVRNQNADWEDIDLMLSELTETENVAVISAVKTHGQGQIATGTLYWNVDNIFPTSNPHWEPNDPQTSPFLVRYRKLVHRGLLNAIPKTINWSLLFDIHQETIQSPGSFVERLRVHMRRHTTLDPASEIGQQQLISLLMGQSAPDICRKLQNVREPSHWNLEKLLATAWEVYKKSTALYGGSCPGYRTEIPQRWEKAST